MTPRGLRKANPTEYSVWSGMISRCENPNHSNYPGYGGRGIGICKQWRESFPVFLADMGPRPSLKHTIDRIDNDRGYDKENCRWATHSQQQRNTRYTRLITFDGRQQCLTAWAEEFCISVYTLWSRLRAMGDDKGMKYHKRRLPAGARSHRMSTSSTGFKGVYKAKGRFRAQLCNHKLRLSLGYYDTPEEAALAYNKKAVELYGDLAKLNQVP